MEYKVLASHSVRYHVSMEFELQQPTVSLQNLQCCKIVKAQTSHIPIQNRTGTG